MGLLDRIRPQSGLAHADAEHRLQAVQQLSASELDLLVPVVRGDADPRVRRAAARRLRDPRLLAEVAGADPEAGVRDAAADVLLGMALVEQDEMAALSALEGLSATQHLASVARSAALEPVSRAALDRLQDERALGSIARHGDHVAIRTEALGRVSDQGELALVALKTEHKDIALLAIERVADPEALEQIAAKARNRAAARRARARLRRPEGAEEAEAVRSGADREAQLRLLESAEELSRSEEWTDLAARIARLQEVWIEEIPAVDDDLDERFREACLLARRRLTAWKDESVARERREAALEELLAPRRLLCQTVEQAEGGETARIVEQARAAWDLLPSSDAPEAAAAQERFESACRAALERHAGVLRSAEAEAVKSRAEDAARESARATKENAARLERLSVQIEKLLRTESAPLAKLERGLRDVRALLPSMPPLASPKEQEQAAQRLRALQSELIPRVQSLRETDRFQRWANAAVQEELCVRMEDLAQKSEEPEADSAVAARGLRELMELWKAAGPAPPERSLALWNQFRAARDRVRARCDVFHAQQIEQEGKNLELKAGLCEKAEAFATSTEWNKTAEAIKGLQIEWKTIGPVSRGREKAVWERFRTACDAFFTRRDEDLSRRKGEWAKNLDAKRALCERAEALAGSTDWKATASEIKRLQGEWKSLGPVKRSQSDAIWNRFHGACDAFFERFKNRDAIERQAIVAERAALCGELEAIAAAAPEAGTDGEPAPPETLVGRLREGLERWLRMRSLPHDQMAPLQERFFGAFDQIIQANPQAVRGTSLDPETNRRRMEEMCARVEKLAGGQPPAVSTADLSPAARLAADLREALASNTMGGRVAEEARVRAAADEVRKTQTAWQRLGYVQEPARRTLQERFDAACRRILDHPAAALSRSAEPARRPSGRPGGKPAGRRPNGRAGAPSRT